MLAVAGTYFVQATALTGEAIAVSVPVALTVTAILNVNNVRDIESDRRAGKLTLAVRLGRRLARWQFVVTVAAAYVAVTALWVFGSFPAAVLLAWLTLPLAIRPLRDVLRQEDGRSLNRALRETARLHLALAVLLAIGLAM